MTETSTMDNDSGATVSMTIRVVDPFTGQALQAVEVGHNGMRIPTDINGIAVLDIPAGPYAVTLDTPGTPTHRVQGVAGNVAFTQITFMGTEAITAQTVQALGLSRDLSKGFLVVGLDRPNLSPAVGASAALDVMYDTAFVFAGFAPSAGTSIPAGGQSFVSFPNAAVGEAQVTVENSDGGQTCSVFPAGIQGEAGTVDLRAGEIAVIAFTCPEG